MQNKDGNEMLDLAALRYFLHASEHGSFTSAAVAHGLTQSAFSRHISQLEHMLGGQLFHRTGRGITLTQRGRRLLPTAQRLLHDADQLVRSMTACHDELEGVVNLGLVPGVSHPIVGQLFNRLKRTYPRLRLSVTESHSGGIEILLSQGHIDIGVFNRYRPSRTGDRRLAVLQNDMVLVGTRLQQDTITFRQAAELPLALTRTPNSLRSYIDEIVARQRLTLNIVFEATPGLAMTDAVLHGDVYTIVPAHAVRSLWQPGTVRAARLTHPIIRQVTLIETTKHHPINLATRIVLQELTLLLRELATTLEPAR